MRRFGSIVVIIALTILSFNVNSNDTFSEERELVIKIDKKDVYFGDTITLTITEYNNCSIPIFVNWTSVDPNNPVPWIVKVYDENYTLVDTSRKQRSMYNLEVLMDWSISANDFITYEITLELDGIYESFFNGTLNYYEKHDGIYFIQVIGLGTGGFVKIPIYYTYPDPSLPYWFYV